MIDAKAAAKAIKRELARQFQGVEFSVRSAIGTCVTVDWRGGPERHEVRRVVARYEYGFRADGTPVDSFSADVGCGAVGVCRRDDFEAMLAAT